MPWKPNVTVAAVIERDGKYLLVEEETAGGLAFNQPAGHLEEGESLVDAVVRETLEETAYHFHPTHLVGIYNWRRPDGEVTYLRFAFAGELRGWEADRRLDAGIVAAHWLTLEEVDACAARHRSPLIRRCIDDLRGGRRYPLDLLVHYA
jgi:ADP-ribose pyrophosphatase YjhB (NUDIX family)